MITADTQIEFIVC